MVQNLKKEKDIDISYFNKLADEAIHGGGSGVQYRPGISDFGDYDWFVSDEDWTSKMTAEDEESIGKIFDAR